MEDTKFDIIKSWFVRDKHSYWWNKYTDYELELSRMSVTELASELNRTKVRNETENTIIVEHILAARLARIQSRASWGVGWLGFIGVILAVLLTFYLGRLTVKLENKMPQTQAQIMTATEDRQKEKPVQPIIVPTPQKTSDTKIIDSKDIKRQNKQTQ